MPVTPDDAAAAIGLGKRLGAKLHWTRADTSTAVFGSWDGNIGALATLIATRHASIDVLVVAGAGATLGNTFSMASGQYESMNPDQPRLRAAIVMFFAALIGGLLAVWPYLWGSKTAGIILAIGTSFTLATIVWVAQGEGLKGALRTYLLLVAVVIATVGLSFG